jgi:glycine cleavage system H protein
MKVGDTFGVVERVKAVSDLYAPVSGEVVEVNAAVVANPALLSDDPYEKAWLLKMKLAPKSDLGSLLKKSEYDATAADH